MRVIDVQGLGWDAAIVNIEGETVLLIDPALDVDERIKVMNEVMAEA